MFRTFFPALAIAFLLICSAHGAPRDQAAIARDNLWAQEERDSAARIRDLEASLATDVFRYGAFMKADLVESKKAAEIVAVLHEKIADALVRGDEEETRRLRKQETQAARVKDLWHERITEWRRRQAETAPNEEWFHDLMRYHQEWLAELLAFSEARKAASEAWGRVADAVVPDADANALIALKDEAYTLDAEREIAESRFNWAYQREVIWNDKKLNNEELKRTLAALQKVQEDRLALRRAEIERDRHARELDRSIHQAEQEFRKAFENAQKEATERARTRPARR